MIDSALLGESLSSLLDSIFFSENDAEVITLDDEDSLKTVESIFELRTASGYYNKNLLKNQLLPEEVAFHLYDDIPKAEIDKIKLAIDKFGINKVVKLFKALSKSVYYASQATTSTIEKLHPLLQYFSPMPRPPKTLYRGMANLSSVPSKGQKIEYTSTRVRYSRWTPILSIAKSFAQSGKKPAIILAANGSALTKSSTVVLWPLNPTSPLMFHNAMSDYQQEKEWIFRIHKPVQVSAYKILT